MVEPITQTMEQAVQKVVQRPVQKAVQPMNHENSFAERIIAFAAVEGILFSESFCAIY